MKNLKDINSFITDPGDPIHVVYGSKVQPNGMIKLEPIGKENTDDFIQSFAESTDISFILAKLAAGDTSVLNQRQVMYGDFTKAPTNLAEAMQLQIDSRNAFDRLPVEVKQKFNNDPNQFFASAGEAAWFDKLGLLKKDDTLDVKQEQKESEVTE